MTALASCKAYDLMRPNTAVMAIGAAAAMSGTRHPPMCTLISWYQMWRKMMSLYVLLIQRYCTKHSSYQLLIQQDGMHLFIQVKVFIGTKPFPYNLSLHVSNNIIPNKCFMKVLKSKVSVHVSSCHVYIYVLLHTVYMLYHTSTQYWMAGYFTLWHRLS